MIEVFGLGNGKDGSEDLFLKDAGFGVYIGNNGGLNEVTLAFWGLATRQQTAFGFSGLDVLQNRFLRPLIYHRAHVVPSILRRPDTQSLRPSAQLLDKLVVDRFIDDGPRASRTFLPAVAKRGVDHTLDSLVDIGLPVHNDGVLATHFRYDPFDPELPFRGLGGEFIDMQAHVAGAGEGDEARFRVGDQDVPNRATAPGQKREALAR